MNASFAHSIRPGLDSAQLLALNIHRRGFIAGCGFGLAGIALQAMLTRDARAESFAWQPPTGEPMFPAKAKRVIWLFMRGGVSHMESFDPKPMLNRYAGKSISDTPYKDVQSPDKLKKLRTVNAADVNGRQRTLIFPLQTGYKAYGQCGVEISDWFPHIGSCADQIAFIRTMWTTDDNHGAQVQFASGRHVLEPRVPTLGAWVNYGLGSMTDELPSFVNMGPRFFDTRDGHYLGPAYDAVNLKVDPKNPLSYAASEAGVSAPEQRAQFDLINQLNNLTAEQYPGDKTLLARLKSYQLAYRMQTAVPAAMNLDDESNETKGLYGLDDQTTGPFARQLMVARRLAERGVRFIQIQHGEGSQGSWDSHQKLQFNHSRLAAQVDKPIAGLLKDLQQRGLLQDTLVVFGTEFGRSAGSQDSDGRDHHPLCFSVWMAGGGLKGGTIHGVSDELGFHPVEAPHYITDLHATILHQLGLDPRKLSLPSRQRLDVDYGEVIRPILA